ncbi:MAG: hypothetical protein JW819_00415 [Candidatus Krumholzibacteriota bacterium]|nr:hypothetical protein [Candidatus Krumholzibacteriota bacterium]
MRRAAAWRLAAALLALGAAGARALPFDTVMPGGRSTAMGGVQSVFCQGADAVLGNPADLGFIGEGSALLMTRDWFDSGLRSWSAAWAQPWGPAGLGVSWHRFGDSDLWTEDVLALGGAWSLEHRRTGALVGLGASLKGLQVAAPAYSGHDYQGDFRTWAVDAALTVEPLSFLRVAHVAENLACGDMTLLGGRPRWRAAARLHRSGVAFRWRGDLMLGAEHVWQEGRDDRINFGAELSFFEAFRVRGGAGRNYASAGFGVDAERWRFDGSYESRGDLGTSLVFSLRFLLGPARGTP